MAKIRAALREMARDTWENPGLYLWIVVSSTAGIFIAMALRQSMR